jgi:hypothetical protein
MPKLLLLLFVPVSACVAIHGLRMMVGLRWLNRTWQRHGRHFSRLDHRPEHRRAFSGLNHLQGRFHRHLLPGGPAA